MTVKIEAGAIIRDNNGFYERLIHIDDKSGVIFSQMVRAVKKNELIGTQVITGENKDTQVINLAIGVKKQLEEISVFGFNEYYGSFNEMLVDLWADLPWDYESSRRAQSWILYHPEFYNTAIKLMEMYDVNMLVEFGKSINFIDKELSL